MNGVDTLGEASRYLKNQLVCICTVDSRPSPRIGLYVYRWYYKRCSIIHAIVVENESEMERGRERGRENIEGGLEERETGRAIGDFEHSQT